MAFCQSWEAYDEAYQDFFDSVEKLDQRLAENRFLFGDYITDSDVRLYVTLVRWETSYYHNIGPMKKRITEYKNLWGYVEDLFSLPVFKKYTLNFRRMTQREFLPAIRSVSLPRFLMRSCGQQMDQEKHYRRILKMYLRSIPKVRA